MTPRHDSMRGWFAAELRDAMAVDERIRLLTGDLGWGMLDCIRDNFPDRFFNVGASEQTLVGAGVGLALSGHIPFCYSITPFLIFRPMEWLRNFLQHEGIPVRLVGSGLDNDYAHDGFTHHSYDVKQALSLFPRIQTHFPTDKEQIPQIVKTMIETDEPSFLCLRR